ncbi:hypothetical protein QCA50_020964 [Cerrena zonata]|uniref:3'-5' exonuclease domain-containing protein n=1 Tax=Cerrena zonata TaxID=2478898 RepID=A0AAW0F8D2_9APHY
MYKTVTNHFRCNSICSDAQHHQDESTPTYVPFMELHDNFRRLTICAEPDGRFGLALGHMETSLGYYNAVVTVVLEIPPFLRPSGVFILQTDVVEICRLLPSLEKIVLKGFKLGTDTIQRWALGNGSGECNFRPIIKSLELEEVAFPNAYDARQVDPADTRDDVGIAISSIYSFLSLFSAIDSLRFIRCEARLSSDQYSLFSMQKWIRNPQIVHVNQLSIWMDHKTPLKPLLATLDWVMAPLALQHIVLRNLDKFEDLYSLSTCLSRGNIRSAALTMKPISNTFSEGMYSASSTIFSHSGPSDMLASLVPWRQLASLGFSSCSFLECLVFGIEATALCPAKSVVQQVCSALTLISFLPKTTCLKWVQFDVDARSIQPGLLASALHGTQSHWIIIDRILSDNFPSLHKLSINLVHTEQDDSIELDLDDGDSHKKTGSDDAETANILCGKTPSFAEDVLNQITHPIITCAVPDLVPQTSHINTLPEMFSHFKHFFGERMVHLGTLDRLAVEYNALSPLRYNTPGMWYNNSIHSDLL